MAKSLDTRLAALERRAAPADPGRIVVVDLTRDLAPEEAERRLADGRARSGEHGMLIMVVEPGYDGPGMGEATRTIKMDWGEDHDED
jgi:hypothetical protein